MVQVQQSGSRQRQDEEIDTDRVDERRRYASLVGDRSTSEARSIKDRDAGNRFESEVSVKQGTVMEGAHEPCTTTANWPILSAQRGITQYLFIDQMTILFYQHENRVISRVVTMVLRANHEIDTC